MGYECLKSVPLIEEDALNLLASFPPYLMFQSTLDYLVDPPEGYRFPGVDLLRGIDDIAEKVRGKAYTSEYDFQIDIYDLIQRAHDGHLGFVGDCLLNGLSFIRSVWNSSEYFRALGRILILKP